MEAREFPPMYTPQPNAGVRESQIEVWKELVKRMVKETRQHRLTNSDVFFANAEIKRKCAPEFVDEIMQSLVRDGVAEVTGKGVYIVLGSEMTDELAKYITDNGLQGSVMTLQEVMDIDILKDQDQSVVKRAVDGLVRRSEAAWIRDAGETGVKFF